MTRSSALVFEARGQAIPRLGRSRWDVAGCSSTPGGDAGSPLDLLWRCFLPQEGRNTCTTRKAEKCKSALSLSLGFPRKDTILWHCSCLTPAATFGALLRAEQPSS